MRTRFALAFCLVPCAAAAAPALHLFQDIAIAPDGAHVASVEGQSTESDRGIEPTLVIRDLAGHAVDVALPCQPGPNCKPASLTWGSDGLAFLLAHPADGTTDIETVGAGGGAPHKVLSFAGPLDGLRYGPGGVLAVLATANAHKMVGRTEAGAPMVGEIGAEIDEQRIALVQGQALHFVSPANLYVYEYDFRPGGGFIGTAAPGDGDSQWWVAKLYAFDPSGGSRVLFAPNPREQIANPVVSPDGASVAFIGGWMSDFGSTGGDAFVLPLGHAGAPENLTRGARETVTAISWRCGDGLTGVSLGGGRLSIARLDARAAKPFWSAEATLSTEAGGALSCGPRGAAAVVSSFADPPEIFAGALGHWRQITHANAGITAPFTARSLSWRNDGFEVQGWLLAPAGGAAAKRPMVVLVHGGPEAAATDRFLADTSDVRALLAQGYYVFEPNYRGSFGQGEAFAAASIQDLGGGDWRDVLTGVDAAEHAEPAIDDRRLGIMGGSYGGYMAMWAVTQTHRFRAAVSHAGVSDWLSIEGEAPQAGSDQVNFGGSVYDNAAPYLKASPIMHMRGVRTPVLITVGERDLECPMPQSEEFDTALVALGVAAEFHVYPGEGHRLAKAADRADFRRRAIAWFARWFGA